MDERNPSIKGKIHGQEIDETIVDGGPGVDVINKTTYDKLGITKWEACPFWLRMAITWSVHPIGLIRNLEFILGGHTFTLSAVILCREVPNAYPL